MYIFISKEGNRKLFKKRSNFYFSEFMDIIHSELLDIGSENINSDVRDLLKIKKKTDLLLYKNNGYVNELYRGLIFDNIFYSGSGNFFELSIDNNSNDKIWFTNRIKKLKIEF